MAKKNDTILNVEGMSHYLRLVIDAIRQTSVEKHYAYTRANTTFRPNKPEIRETVDMTIKELLDASKKHSKIRVEKYDGGTDNIVSVTEYPSWDICAIHKDNPSMWAEDTIGDGFCYVEGSRRNKKHLHVRVYACD